MRRMLLPILFLTISPPVWGLQPGGILPRDVKYDSSIPTPEKVLGFAIGSRHLHHHQLVQYLEKLAQASSRVTLKEYGRTHGDRPLIYLTITHPENQRKLSFIQEQHRKLADPKVSGEVAIDALPAVIWMGYGVHGNEPSASNVAALVAYHLAAATGEEHDRLLREIVVLLDPCLNPEGFERFAQWANSNRGKVANADPEHREHREPWPSGRTNYYWFDLNRDWLPAQHPESQGRLAIYHQWKPNVVLDFHEMGSTSTFFFQPGVPTRNHPLVPAGNLQLTRALARYHARALDRIGSLYFTEEQFDDYYPGKGSTYPDVHGGVGILFEQASSRGQVQDTPHGKLTFPFTIRNQFETSRSSLQGLLALRPRFLEYKRTFYRSTVEAARKSKVKGIVLAAPEDSARLHHFLTMLSRHDLRIHRLKTEVKIGERTFRAKESFVLPTDQPEARFLQVLFERRTEFADKTFYDISTWTAPLAFNVQDAPLTEDLAGERYEPGRLAAYPLTCSTEDLAYLIDWRNDHAPRALHRLLAGGIKVRVAAKEFQYTQDKQVRRFPHGTLMVPVGIQAEKRAALVEILSGAAKEGVPIYPVQHGLALEGIKLGSSAFAAVPTPRVLLVTGEGVSAYEAGEVWHLLDQRVGMPVTMVETHRLSGVELEKYSVVVLVSGTYAGVSERVVERLRQYAERGGTLVAVGTAISWLNANKVLSVRMRAARRTGSEEERRPYDQASADAAEQLISGAIFRTRTDTTHPVCYGLPSEESLPVFRNNRVILEPTSDPYSTPVIYDKKPLLSGYVSARNQELLAGSASAAVVPVGSGRALLLVENPNFRAYWYGTSRLFVNALFFGPITRAGTARAR